MTDTVRLLCNTIKKNQPEVPIKFVLMNTAGNRNRGLNEAISFGEKAVIGLLRLLLPPHPDNEKAADYLRINIGKKDPSTEWVVVRLDSLINEASITDYALFVSPTRSAIFNAGKSSRINVGHLWLSLLMIVAHGMYGRIKCP
ncbi:hypothetical protein [Catalinimonas niigatensis]|uniref:hypothetical protein n=1 Tax=Catalinimonas niigatensis TaxID=1397264 RepID=UPI0026657159|nr:hypothetical protein [Catalinimonas niigatensis]WPP51427.1 hypothetical protein PZB72_03375 [Catalinimonas niigatensis]